jgi:hypothetical protein
MSSKPWFLRSKRLGDYSHLRWDDFRELREVVSDAVAKYADSSWRKIKNAALTALEDLAKKHHCGSLRDAEGGHVCIYKNEEPVFALRIGNYSRHRVEDLLEGRALYRGIIDILPPSPIPNNLSSEDALFFLIGTKVEPMKVLYFLLPTRGAGKWKNQEARDMVDVIECVKAHPSFSRSDIQHTLNFSPRKTIRLLDLLKRRRILHRRGHYKSSGWYLNYD